MKESEVYPSISIWQYYERNAGAKITPQLITCGISDIVGGFHVSYSMTELLKDLNLLKENNKPTKEALVLMAMQIHEKFFRDQDGFKVIKPWIS